MLDASSYMFQVAVLTCVLSLVRRLLCQELHALMRVMWSGKWVSRTCTNFNVCNYVCMYVRIYAYNK